MSSLPDMYNLCTATLSGRFGVRVIRTDPLDQTVFSELRPSAANAATHSRVPVSGAPGYEQGNK